MKMGRKKLATACLTLGVACCAFGFASAAVITASAGFELKEPTKDAFDDGRISDFWVTDNAEIVLQEGTAPALQFTDAAEGAGLVTLNEVSADSICMELDFDGLNFSNGGWLGLMFGTKSTQPILDWAEFGRGDKYITLSYHPSLGWMFRTYYNVDGSPKVYHFVDENGKDTCLATYLTEQGSTPSAGDESYYLIDLPSNGGVLKGITISVKLDKDGNFVFSYRNANEEANADKILAKSKDVPFEGYKQGHLGFCVMQGGSRINGNVNDFRTYVNGSTEANTKFRFEQENFGSDYLMDPGASVDSVAFVRSGKMRLNAKGGETYAVHKTAASFDTNVVNSVVAKNIEVSEMVYLEDFDDDDAFFFHFGLEKASNMAIGTSGTYAVKVSSESGMKYFQVIRYTSDDGDYVNVTENTAVSNTDMYVLTLKIDGDGCGCVTFGDQTQTLSNLTFGKNRVFFANALQGTAIVSIDSYSMTNAIYSKPDNKDLFADFTDDDINIKEWYLPSWGGNLEERYDGVYAKNNQLVFKNVNSNAGITTKAQFSNYDLSFDITDVQRAGVDDGATSTDIRVMYGIQGYKDGFNTLYIAEERPMFTLRPSDDGKTTNYSILHIEGEKAGTLPGKYNIFAAESEGLIFNVRLTMTDGLISAYVKLSTETEWYEIFSIQTSGSITGHIRISGYGDGVLGDGACSNFCIDNLSVKNTDKSPNNTADYGYESNKAWIAWDGFEYEDTWNDDDLLPIYQEEAQKGCSSSMNGVTTVLGAALLIGAAFVFVKDKKGEKNEK